MKKIKIVLLTALTALCISMTVLAAEDTSIDTEIESFEEIETWDGDIERSIDGIYNTYPDSRAALTGSIKLSKSGTKLITTYTTTYSNAVNKIGAKNIKLKYKTTLGIWNTIVTLDDRYNTNMSSYMGSFSVTGTVGRTYMVSLTHYISGTLESQTKYNETNGFTF